MFANFDRRCCCCDYLLLPVSLFAHVDAINFSTTAAAAIVISLLTSFPSLIVKLFRSVNLRQQQLTSLLWLSREASKRATSSTATRCLSTVTHPATEPSHARLNAERDAELDGRSADSCRVAIKASNERKTGELGLFNRKSECPAWENDTSLEGG